MILDYEQVILEAKRLMGMAPKVPFHFSQLK